jgi:hypothetical protein
MPYSSSRPTDSLKITPPTEQLLGADMLSKPDSNMPVGSLERGVVAYD